jgi:uncharacterized membrane protein
MQHHENYYRAGSEDGHHAAGADWMRRRYRGNRSLRLVTAVALLASLALAVSCYLVFVALSQSKIAGCDAGQIFDCGHVLSSRWSQVFGIPVSLPAAGLYVLMLSGIAVFVIRQIRHRFSSQSDSLARQTNSTQSFIVVLAITAALSALWFIGLQLFVLKHFCTYCLVAHGCGLAIAGLLTVYWRSDVPLGKLASASAVAVGLLIAVQLLSPAPATYAIESHATSPATENAAGTTSNRDDLEGVFEFDPDVESSTDSGAAATPSLTPLPRGSARQARQVTTVLPVSAITPARKPFYLLAQATSKSRPSSLDTNQPNVTAPRRIVTAVGGSLKLDIRQWPRIGSPAAKLVVIEMFDYACPHCRTMQTSIRGARERLGNALAVITIPVPMNAECNPTVAETKPDFVDACELARLAVAVWRIAPSKFEEFHEFLLVGPKAPPASVARGVAARLVGEQRLSNHLESGIPQRYLQKNVEMYERVGKGIIPKLLFPNTTLVGEIGSVDTLVEMIERDAVQQR